MSSAHRFYNVVIIVFLFLTSNIEAAALCTINNATIFACFNGRGTIMHRYSVLGSAGVIFPKSKCVQRCIPRQRYNILWKCGICPKNTLTPSTTPSGYPSSFPSMKPTSAPSPKPSSAPSTIPSPAPSTIPSSPPSIMPSGRPLAIPSINPSRKPSVHPSRKPSVHPSSNPSIHPSRKPSAHPSRQPSAKPSRKPSAKPSRKPSAKPSRKPSAKPSRKPSARPSTMPSGKPTVSASQIDTCQNAYLLNNGDTLVFNTTTATSDTYPVDGVVTTYPNGIWFKIIAKEPGVTSFTLTTCDPRTTVLTSMTFFAGNCPDIFYIRIFPAGCPTSTPNGAIMTGTIGQGTKLYVLISGKDSTTPPGTVAISYTTT